MKNTLPATSVSRQPRALVQVNGTRIDGLEEIEVEENGGFRADTYRVTWAISGLPRANGLAWFDSQTELDVEVFAGLPTDPTNVAASDLDSLILGKVDDISVQWETGTLTVTGRDRTADMIDVKTSKKWANMKPEAIVQQIAAGHGLTAAVQPTDVGFAGKLYEIDKVRLQDDRTEWDLIVWLAREVGFTAFVKGTTLYFQPAADPGQDPYVLQYTGPQAGQTPKGNFVRLQTSHTLTIAKGLKVTVRSWNHKQKKVFERTASRGGSNPQQYVYTIPNLDPEQAQSRANQILADLSKHERKLVMEGPADNLLTKTDVIQLQGTGTGADQIYYPDVISRTLTKDGGYTMRAQAKNQSPQSENAQAVAL